MPAVLGRLHRAKEGVKRPAIFAYGSSPQSTNCAERSKEAFERWGADPVVFDTSLSFGFSANDISGAVQAIKDNQVDFVSTCMDLNGMLNIKKAIEAAGIDGVHYLAPQGYDAKTMKELGEDIDEMYFLAQFMPFEAAQDNPGMQKFLKAMKANGKSPNEILLVGWSGAALLVEGLKAAGKNPTQQGVVDAINQITDWNAQRDDHQGELEDGARPGQPGDQAAAPSCRQGRQVRAVVRATGEAVRVLPGQPLLGHAGQPHVRRPVSDRAAGRFPGGPGRDA